MARNEVRERMLQGGPGVLSDQELLSTLGADGAAGQPVRELAWLSVAELRSLGLNEAQAAGLARPRVMHGGQGTAIVEFCRATASLGAWRSR